MGREFGVILRGLMDNRQLTLRAVSRATMRAESTIHSLLNGAIEPRADHLRDLAAVLQMAQADLAVIAGLSLDSEAAATRPRPTPPREIGELVAVASRLTGDRLGELVDLARRLEAEQ